MLRRLGSQRAALHHVGERLARPDSAARERLSTDAVGNPPRFRTLLAEVDSQIVGYAIYFFTYSTFRARPTLYLEDVFVPPERRGVGAGVGAPRSPGKGRR